MPKTFGEVNIKLHLARQGWVMLPAQGDKYCPEVCLAALPQQCPVAYVTTKAAPVFMRVAQEERHGLCVRLWEELLVQTQQYRVWVFLWEAKPKMLCAAPMTVLKHPVSMGPASGRFCAHGMAFFPRRLFGIFTEQQFLQHDKWTRESATQREIVQSRFSTQGTLF